MGAMHTDKIGFGRVEEESEDREVDRETTVRLRLGKHSIRETFT